MARDRPRRPHALLTDEPGVVLADPRRRLVRLLVLYALLPLICSGAGAYIAYALSAAAAEDRVDRAVADLNSYLAERREAAAEANQQQDAQLKQTRRDLCVVVDRVQPRDAAVQEMRRRYGCTDNPTPTPTPSASTPAGGQRGGGGGRTPAPTATPRAQPGRPGPPGPSGPPGPPAPTPPKPSTPPPAPDRPELIDICIPLINLCI